MVILRKTRRSIGKAMLEVHLIVRERAKDLMPALGLNEAIDQLAMESVAWHGQVLRRESSRVVKETLKSEVKGQKKKWTPKII